MWLTWSTMLLLAAYAVEARRGYILTAPKAFLAGETERVCIKIFEVSSAVAIEFKITSTFYPRRVYPLKSLLLGASGSSRIERCVDLAIPEMRETVSQAHFEVSGDDRRGYRFRDSKRIGIKHKSIMVFIQTDKAIYKPGQNVRIRCVTLTYDIKPLSDLIDLFYVENPKGTRMIQWTDNRPNQGISDFEMTLSKDPVLGVWKIIAEIKGKKYFKMFEVKEYVLPKFEIIIKPQPYILWKDTEIKGEVCAKYTYGKPVEGVLKLNACIEYPLYYLGRFSVPCYLQTKPIKGCVSFVIKRDDTDMYFSYHFPYGAISTRLSVFAEVNETGTGVALNATNDDTTLDITPVKLKLKSPNYFKPGLSYYGKVIVSKTGGSAAPSELVKLKLSVSGSVGEERYFITDAKGVIDFALPNMPTGVSQVTLLAQALWHRGMNNLHPSDTKSMKAWYSRNGRFIQIEPVRQTAVPGITVSVNVTFTSKHPDSNTFYYEVQSLGNIVVNGSRYIKVGYIDGTTGVPGAFSGTTRWPDSDGTQGPMVGRPGYPGQRYPPVPTPPGPGPAPPLLPHKDYFILKLVITPSMSPNARLVVYSVQDDGEVVADSTEIDVQEFLENQVKMEFADKERMPGEETILKIKADSGSLCAYGVVDKSVHILGGNGQLTISDVFSQLRQYELNKNSGPYITIYNSYCSRRTSPTPVRPPGSYISGYTTVDNYLDSKDAFKDMRMLVMSDLDIESRPCWREPNFSLYYYYSWRRIPFMPSFPGTRGMQAAPRGERGPIGFRGPAGPGGMGDQFGPVEARRPARPPARPPALPTTTPTTATFQTTLSPPQEDEQPTVELRNYFPETWLWDLQLIGQSEEIEMPKTLPDTITEWIGSAFCTNIKTGLGVSPPAKIQAFQPFFVSFSLPYSVVRGEQIHLPVTVFNYLKECLVIKLEMEDSLEYTVAGDKTTHRCVCGSETKTQIYKLIFSEIGKTNVSVQGLSVTKRGVCGDNQITSKKSGVGDAVRRQLLVEPEGREEEYSFSEYICVEGGGEQSLTTELTLPTNLVNDSARGEVSVIGNVLGPTLSGLDKLLKLPTGCGEQNMVGFAPDIYILQYLTNTDQLTNEFEKKALQYLKTGYQRELNYKHSDGSYSAFGNRDKEGSTWLTAFVVKCFGQAKPYIFIDQNDLDQSINWLRRIQGRNGCFEKKGRMLNRGMKGGLSNAASSPVTLTSYVLVSLLEAGVSKSDSIVTNAIRCLDGYSGSDTYTITLMAYAYSLWNRTSRQVARKMTKLNELAIDKDGLKHWSRTPGSVVTPPPAYSWRRYRRAPSADVEMTSYALLANLVAGGTSHIGDVVPIVKWLSKQRNPLGGFASTQDTIVALQALAQFANLTSSNRIELMVEVKGDGIDHQFEIRNDNALVLQRIEITVPNSLTFHVEGRGCALVQANVLYNVLDSTLDLTAFQLNVSTTIHNTNCDEAYIIICVKYSGLGNSSDMTIVSVKMVSGWGADRNSLATLLKDKSLDLKKFEIELNKVTFYFEELTSEVKCFRFRVKKFMVVTAAKPANVEVYDYYDTDLSAKKQYSIPECQ